MSTVGEVVDRTLWDLLHPPDDTPVQTTVTGALTNVATSVPYADVLSPDEEELLAPGVTVEVDLEKMIVTAADHTTNTLTVRRGAYGTTAVAHNSGAVLSVAPVFSRVALFKAVADNVVALYPRLYRVLTTAVTFSTSTPFEAPVGIVAVVGGRYLSGGRYHPVGVDLLQGYGSFASGNAIASNVSGAGYLTYRAKFTRPTLEADNLQTLGVDESWERILMVGAAAQMLSVRELDAVNVEFVTEAMRSEGFPVGSATRLRESLLRYHALLLDQARNQLLGQYPESVLINSAV